MKENQEYLGDFPIEEVEFDPHEIEELIGTKKSGKRKSMYPQKTQFLQKRTRVKSLVTGARI